MITKCLKKILPKLKFSKVYKVGFCLKYMAKKESANRGYMTKEEIISHLPQPGFSPYHDSDNREYIWHMLKKGGKGLSPKTKVNAYLILAESGEPTYYANAAEILHKYLNEPKEAAKFYHLAAKRETEKIDEDIDDVGYHADGENRMKSVNKWQGLAEKLDPTTPTFHRGTGKAINWAEELSGLGRILKSESAKVSLFLLGIFGGLFFLSSNMTGNVIGNVSQGFGNILGAGFLVVGLVAGFYLIKKRK